MAINFILAPAVERDARADPMGRTWVGWDPSRSDAELWETNRGVWRLDGERIDAEQYATLSFDGRVRVVARIDGVEIYTEGTTTKKALTGQVLPPAHPVAAALMALPVPSQRNPVAYLETADVERVPVVPVADRPAPAVPAYLLTHNPDRWAWPEDDLRAAVEATREGRSFKGSWATGTRTSGIAPGDRAFLLRQGAEPRGVVASGIFRSEVYTDRHFDEHRSDEAPYALVDWDTVLDVDDVLPLAVLQARVPQGAWTPMGSGTRISSEALTGLETLWAEHRAAVAPAGARAGGQGHEPDAARRRAIEDAAQDRLMAHFCAEGWEVEDVRTGHPYDARATRGAETLYLEAKGTQGDGAKVLVTQGEVAHARAHPGQCVLGILAGVVLDEAGAVVAGTGTLAIHAWDPDDGELLPLTYSYAPATH